MKNKIVLLMSLLTLGSQLIGCNHSPSTKGTADLTSKESLALEAVTSLNLLSTGGMGKRLLKQANPTLSNEEEKEMEQLLPQLDLMLENGFSFKSEKTAYNEAIGDVIYANKEIISFNETSGEKATYSLFYNEKENVIEQDEDETETKSYIEGVVSFDESEFFSFSSILKTEKEEDEYEEKREFIVHKDEQSFVKVEQIYEMEGNEKETKFEYEYVKDGIKQTEYSFNFENEGTRSKIEYEFNNLEYELEKYIDSSSKETIYKVKYENEENNIETTLHFKKIVSNDGTVHYEKIIH